MKKITLLFTLLLSTVFYQIQGQTLFDYETPATSTGFGSWGAAGFAQIANPDKSGINTSDNVGQFSHDGSAGYIGIESDGAFDNIDFTATPYFRMKVWVDEPVEIIFKLQNNPSWWENSEQKYYVTESETDQWIELAFNFEGNSATNYNRVVLYFDGGNNIPSGAGHKYYFDDIEKSNVPPPALVSLNPANGETDVNLFTMCTIESNYSMQNIDDSEITEVSSIVWLKEGSATGTDVGFEAFISDDKKKISILPNQLIDPSTTYFYGVVDNVIEHSTGEVVVGVSSSFTTTTDAPLMTVYNDFDGNSLCSVVETMGDVLPLFSIVDDPENNSNKVLKFEKNSAWSGWNRVHLELQDPIDLTQDKVFSMRVYSPIKTWVRLKIGDQKEDGGHNYEQDSDVLVIDGWQTLYFDYSSNYASDTNAADATDFKYISIYFGGGDATPNDFLIDDVVGASLATTASIKDFEIEGLAAYPNPTNSKWTISTRNQEIQAIEVYNVIGKRVLSLKPNTMSAKVDASSLAPGVYIATITTEKGTSSRKLIKN